MRKIIFTLLVVMMVFTLGIMESFAQEETVFSGNLRMGYKKLYNDAAEEWMDDGLSLHFLELWVRKQVGDFGIFVNQRIGDANNNYLWEGQIYYNIPNSLGKLNIGLVRVPFGIYANGLYYPKGILYDKNWMWDRDYGITYEGKFQLSDTLGIDAAAGFLTNQNGSGELGAFTVEHPDCAPCTGENNNISGRVGADITMEDALALKVGGSVQTGKLMREDAEDDTKLGIAGDVTVDLNMLPVPVSVWGEFVNYSLADIDAAKGNILGAQLNITSPAGMEIGPIGKMILSLHLSQDMPKDDALSSKTALIGQLRLIMHKNFNIFAQVFGNSVEGADGLLDKGVRVWLMYIF
ncbi:hypothetical protein GF312_13650 [Candidatus Poribacteria bacterium]|nr:hypothetical protein [Candidatus Poribacteria bacterium]